MRKGDVGVKIETIGIASKIEVFELGFENNGELRGEVCNRLDDVSSDDRCLRCEACCCKSKFSGEGMMITVFLRSEARVGDLGWNCI